LNVKNRNQAAAPLFELKKLEISGVLRSTLLVEAQR
jgi:hypothetical protein